MTYGDIMLGIPMKRKQVSFRLDPELTQKIEHLEKALPGQNIYVSSMCQPDAIAAISKGIDHLYKVNNIPLPNLPKTPEERVLATMKEVYKKAGAPLPEMSEEVQAVLLEELRKNM